MGASLLAKAVCQSTHLLNVPTSSRASSLPQWFVVFAKLLRGSNITPINHPVQRLSARLDSAQPQFQVGRHVRDAAQFPQSGFRAV
ncbi:hypothetical protein FGA82_12510 [Pseudomonas fluorescens]|nr:hypothetical protein FGA82_12510 [Pseudomonas fluorescens]